MSEELMIQKKIYTEDEKIRAAYALNMCTVSVSQIIDYNDAYILEQEYEAILNNLNLQQIPKDEALLRILVELLNTISFFKIQDIRKKQIEKKYQDDMKNAIWSAIPNIGVIVTSGNPIAIGISLATQVGSGYINYRRAKAQGQSAKQDSEIELQITALEQFNALKRELFTTAWRLAAEYGFEDRFRLSERQIKQYNEILMDSDEFRKYARLDAIKDKFDAYPPFWYFIGHTACYIAEKIDDEETKMQYRRLAKSHFDHYEELNKYNILREDQITASFALEYVDLLFLEKERDNNKICELLEIAKNSAGNHFDVLQLCVISYLRIGKSKEAALIMRMLVNEDYNTVINSQLLSGYYVRTRNVPEYTVLRSRVSPRYLYPMPTREVTDYKVFNEIFEDQQRKIMKEKLKKTLLGVLNKYNEEVNKKTSVFDLEHDYPQDYFADTDRSKHMRITTARQTYENTVKWNYYLNRMRTMNLQLEYTNAFEELFTDLFKCKFCADKVLQDSLVENVSHNICKNKNIVNSVQEKIENGEYDIHCYEKIQKTGLNLYVIQAFEILYQRVCSQIESMTINDLVCLEGDLISLCNRVGIELPEVVVADTESYDDDDFSENFKFDVSLFGNKAVIERNNVNYLNEMLRYIKDKMSRINISEQSNSVIYKDCIDFERYFNNSIFEEYPALKANALMVLKDNTESKFDLIFTTEGIVYVLRDKVRKKAPYKEISFVRDSLDLYGKKYKNADLDLAALYEMIQGFGHKFIGNLERKTDYFEGIADGKKLNEWFKRQPNAMNDTVTRAYAWPISELMEHMGFVIEKELDRNTHIIQFYYDNESGNIMDYRIVEFEKLDAVFASKLNKAGGVIKVGR